ncbi:MAG: glycerophosphodiester phosphodiesterase [Armatimonadota bacterium]
MILYGHRGAKGEAPENTVTGFAYAQSIGVRDFEFDVRLSADHELIVLHDATVDRTTNTTGKRAAADLTYSQIAALDARAEFTDWPQPCGIPTLAEVLAEITDRAHMEIEIKRDEPERLEILVAKMVQVLETLPDKERIVVTSFDPTALAIMRRVAPHFSRGYIGAYDTPAFLETAISLECRQAGIPLMTGSKEVVQEAQRNGLRVTGWPGDSREQLQILVDWGVENITTNNPSIAIPFLRERGLLDTD